MQPVKVRNIKKIGIEDVYNLEVKDYHNFSVNGGVIVHNSIDSIRYGTENIREGSSAKVRILGA